MKLIKARLSEPHCIEHVCDDCDRKLYVRKWWGSALIAVIFAGAWFSAMVGLQWLAPTPQSSDEICFVREQIGTSSSTETYRTKDVDCPK